MKNFKKIKLRLMPVIALVAMDCTSRHAFAAIERTTTPFGNTPVVLTFKQFNPALGALTGVRITLETGLQANIDIGNKSNYSLNYSSFTATLALTVIGPDTVHYGSEDAVLFPGCTIPANSHHADTQLGGFNSATFDPISPDSYVGAKTFDLKITAGDLPYVSATGGRLSVINSSASLLSSGNSISVSFDYIPAKPFHSGAPGPDKTTPVPEPSTYFAGIAALGMLCWARGTKKFPKMRKSS